MSIKVLMDQAAGAAPSKEQRITAQNFLASQTLKQPDGNGSSRYFLLERSDKAFPEILSGLKQSLNHLDITPLVSGAERSSKVRVIIEEKDVPDLLAAIEMGNSRKHAKTQAPGLDMHGMR